MDSLLTKRNAFIIVAALALWKTYLSAALQLHPDEAYYWLWSRHLDLGYFDHPPLVAYLIRLTTLFSQQELWVRFGGIVETFIVSALAWSLSLRLFGDEKTAAAGVVTLNALPLTLAGSVVMTPDNPAFLFTGAAVYLYWQIVATAKVRYWYFLGAAFGLALLSKYTGALLAPCLLLFMLATDERRWLKTVHPYAAFFLGLAFFLPVVYWNSRHQWASFAFQLHHGLGGASYRLRNIPAFIGGQMLVAGPLLFPAGAAASVLALFRRNKAKLFLSLTSLPVLLFFAYSSLKRTAAPNWPCCAYFSFSILAGRYLLAAGKGKRAFWAAGIVVSLLIAVTAGLQARFGVLPLGKISPALLEADASNSFYGWRELAEDLEKDPARAVAFADTSQLASEITYYTRERITGYVDYRHFGAGQYQYWELPDRLRGKSGVCVQYREGYAPVPCAEYFGSLEKSRTLTAARDGFPLRTYVIVSGKDCRIAPLSERLKKLRWPAKVL